MELSIEIVISRRTYLETCTRETKPRLFTAIPYRQVFYLKEFDEENIGKGYKGFVDYNRHRLNRCYYEINELQLKVDFPIFNGNLDIEEFLN
jgi:hypothetical protein